MPSRREILKLLSFGGAGLATGVLPMASALASGAGSTGPYDGPFLLFCTFDGGWDTLLCTDPRDATDPRFGEDGTIQPRYDLVRGSDVVVRDVLDNVAGDSGLYRPPGASFSVGPAMYTLARDHWEDLCIVRGMEMGTLTHAVGRRYFLTGRFPRGLTAAGASLSTVATAGFGDHTPIGNLVVGMEAYNEGQPSWATGLSVREPLDILSVLSPLSPRLAPEAMDAVRGFTGGWGCEDYRLDGGGVVSSYRQQMERADGLASGLYATPFDYLDPTPETQAVLNALGVESNSQMDGPLGQAFLAAQAITCGVAQSVSIRLAVGIDHHDDDWTSEHAPALREGFDALARLMTFLKSTLDHNGQPFWNRTTLLVSSEFARTPYVNSQLGRDHHLSSGCIAAGAGIRGNTVIGETDDYYVRKLVDPDTGRADSGGTLIRPPDVHATVLNAMGVSDEHLANQTPVILEAMLS